MTEQEVFVAEKYSDRISDLLSRSNSMLETVGFEPEDNAQDSSTISLVFVGPYDVGKSSINHTYGLFLCHFICLMLFQCRKILVRTVGKAKRCRHQIPQ